VAPYDKRSIRAAATLGKAWRAVSQEFRGSMGNSRTWRVSAVRSIADLYPRDVSVWNGSCPVSHLGGTNCSRLRLCLSSQPPIPAHVLVPLPLHPSNLPILLELPGIRRVAVVPGCAEVMVRPGQPEPGYPWRETRRVPAMRSAHTRRIHLVTGTRIRLDPAPPPRAQGNRPGRSRPGCPGRA
jgi:hypothetical protein